jgi:hypothetical protein
VNPWYILVAGLFTGAGIGTIASVLCVAGKCADCKYNNLAVHNLLSHREIHAVQPLKPPRSTHYLP